MTREHSYLCDPELTRCWVQERFGVEITYALAVEFLEHLRFSCWGYLPGSLEFGCLTANYATSAGAIIFIETRLLEHGLLRAAGQDEPLPLIIDARGVRVADVARSKVFKTALHIQPINLLAWIVAGNRRQGS